MPELIRQQAQIMGYSLDDDDIRAIIQNKFHLVVTGNPLWIRAAIKAWMED